MKSINPYLLSGALVLVGCAAAQAENIKNLKEIPSAEEVVIKNLLAYGPKKQFCPRNKMMKEMNFTDKQLEKAVEAKIKTRKKVAPIITEIMDLKHQLKNVVTAPSIDKDKARDLHNQIVVQMQKLANLHFELKLEMADQLTDKQKSKLRSKTLKMELLSGPMMMPGPMMFAPPPPMGGPMMFGPPPMPPHMMKKMMSGQGFPGFGGPEELGSLEAEEDPLVS